MLFLSPKSTPDNLCSLNVPPVSFYLYFFLAIFAIYFDTDLHDNTKALALAQEYFNKSVQRVIGEK